MTKFANHFLISMPHMTDAMFRKSLVYICEHDKKGAMGLIVNKPIPSDNVGEILQQTRLDKADPHPQVYFGGPVSINQGFILHDYRYKVDGTFELSEEMSLTSNPKIVDDIISGNGPEYFRFTMGYAGWGENQLEREFENGDWLVMPANTELVFQLPDDQKWELAARKLGIDIMDISGSTGFA